MKFIDLFSGIGGFRAGLEKHGHECVAFCEKDKYARQSYKAIYNTEGEKEWHDISQVSNEEFRAYRGRADIITGGFPCQAFSIAGNRRGFEDTRGTLFFEIARAIKEIQPSYALLENVKGLFSHDKGRTFGTIIQALDELGYVVEWGLFNSKFWGVPQNRERVFILVTRKDVFKGPKLFDLLKEQTEVNARLVDVLEDEVEEKFYLSEEKTKKLSLDTDLGGKLNMQDGDQQPKIAIKGFKEIVKVRKYVVNTLKLSKLLRISKQNACITNKEISNKLDVPITKVEHWFRRDKSFSIPDAQIWFKLKTLLNITNTEYDEAVTTFEEKESEFDTTNRIYDVGHLSPTLNTASEPKIAVLGNTSNTGHRSHDVHHVEGIIPTIAARDYKGPKQIAILNNSSEKNCNFYVKDNTVVSEEVFYNDPFEYDYEYIDPEFKQIGEYYLLVNQDGSQAEVLNKLKEGVYETVRVVHDVDEIIKLENITSKEEKAVLSGLYTNAAEDFQRPPLKGLSRTLKANNHDAGITDGIRIRKLTPLECWRLQGFTDEQFYKAKDVGVSNSQLYKQAGNSVTVNVIDAIAKVL